MIKDISESKQKQILTLIGLYFLDADHFLVLKDEERETLAVIHTIPELFQAIDKNFNSCDMEYLGLYNYDFPEFCILELNLVYGDNPYEILQDWTVPKGKEKIYFQADLLLEVIANIEELGNNS